MQARAGQALVTPSVECFYIVHRKKVASIRTRYPVSRLLTRRKDKIQKQHSRRILKASVSANPFFHSLCGIVVPSMWTAFADLRLGPDLSYWALVWFVSFIVSFLHFLFLITGGRLSWRSQLFNPRTQGRRKQIFVGGDTRFNNVH